MCWSFLTSKNAGEGVTSSRRNCSTISLERPDLDAVLRPPAEQGEVVDHRLGQVALGGEVGHGHGVLALRQLLPTLVDEHRQVGEHLGAPEVERVAQQQVLGGTRHVVLAAHDVGDPHLGVVVGVREQEHRHARGAQEHEVLDGLVLEAHLAAHHVGEARGALVGGPEPQRGGVALREALGRGRSRRSRAGRRAPWPGPAPARWCSRTSRPGPWPAARGPPPGGRRGCRPGTRCRRPSRGPASAARPGCSPPARSSSAPGPCPPRAGASRRRCGGPPAS